MPLFEYRAKQPNGSMAEGQIEADGRQEALRQVEAKGLRLVGLAERGGASSNRGPDADGPSPVPVVMHALGVGIGRQVKTQATSITAALIGRREPTWETPALACFVCLLMATIFVTPVVKWSILTIYYWQPTPTATRLFLGPSYAYVVTFGAVISALLAKDWMIASPSARKWVNLASLWVGLILCAFQTSVTPARRRAS
jgi:hypothetical protein